MEKTFYFLIILILFACKSKSDLALAPNPTLVLPLPDTLSYNSIIANQCNFILSHQLNDGAFTMSSNRDVSGYKIVPYFANIAARALLENPTNTNIDAVKRWITWYFDHLNPDGSVFDYFATNYHGEATLLSTGDFDSIDSYAATFITLIRKLCEVSPPDKSWLKLNYSKQLIKAGEAMALMMQEDGLTIAKPSYQIKYTMDNTEVNEGLIDMVWLSQNVVSNIDISTWQVLLDKNGKGIETLLWDNSEAKYFMYQGGPVANWKVFYADATCQLYPIWCGVILPTSQRAKDLWNTFNINYPDWAAGKIYDNGGYPWTVISYVSAVMNDKIKTDHYLRYVQSFLDTGIQPTNNWYNLEAAFVILAAKKIKGLTN